MSCFICQAFGENSPSNPQLAQECPLTPLSSLHSLHHIPMPRSLFVFPPLSLSLFLSTRRPTSPSVFFSVCLLVFSGMAVGTGLKRGEGSIGAKAHKPIRRQRVAVAIGSHTAKLALLTWSSWLLFLLFRSWCASLVLLLFLMLPVSSPLCCQFMLTFVM